MSGGAAGEQGRSYCPHCGAPVDGGGAYCGACGGRLGPSAARSAALSGKRRAAYLVIVLIAAASFTGALYSLGAAAASDSQGFATYSNPRAGVEFGYPSGWSPAQNGSAVAEFIGGNGAVTLQLFDEGSSSQPVSTAVNETLALLGANHNNAAVTLAQDLTVSGEVVSEVGIGVGDRASLVTFFTSTGDYYALVCTTTYELFYQTLGTCESVSSTLVLRP